MTRLDIFVDKTASDADYFAQIAPENGQKIVEGRHGCDSQSALWRLVARQSRAVTGWPV